MSDIDLDATVRHWRESTERNARERFMNDPEVGKVKGISAKRALVDDMVEAVMDRHTITASTRIEVLLGKVERLSKSPGLVVDNVINDQMEEVRTDLNSVNTNW